MNEDWHELEERRKHLRRLEDVERLCTEHTERLERTDMMIEKLNESVTDLTSVLNKFYGGIAVFKWIGFSGLIMGGVALLRYIVTIHG